MQGPCAAFVLHAKSPHPPTSLQVSIGIWATEPCQIGGNSKINAAKYDIAFFQLI